MYTKISVYSIQENKKEEFLDLMEESQEIFLNHLGGNVKYLRSVKNPEEWIQISQFENQSLYDEQIAEIRERLEEIHYDDRLRELVSENDKQIPEADYEEFMSIIHEEE